MAKETSSSKRSLAFIASGALLLLTAFGRAAVHADREKDAGRDVEAVYIAGYFLGGIIGAIALVAVIRLVYLRTRHKPGPVWSPWVLFGASFLVIATAIAAATGT